MAGKSKSTELIWFLRVAGERRRNLVTADGFWDGVFPVNGFWLCGNFGLAEAAKAAETVHKAFRPLGLAIVNPFVKNCPTTQNRRYLAVDWQDRIKFTSPAAPIGGFETGPA